MSVIIMITFDAPTSALEDVLRNGYADLLTEVSTEGRSRGCLHHQFIEAGDGRVMAIDEWERIEDFQSFFDGNERIGKIVAAAGVTAPPAVTVHRILDTPDRF